MGGGGGGDGIQPPVYVRGLTEVDNTIRGVQNLQIICKKNYCFVFHSK